MKNTVTIIRKLRNMVTSKKRGRSVRSYTPLPHEFASLQISGYGKSLMDIYVEGFP